MRSWRKLAQKLRVPVGTLLGVVFLLMMHPSNRSLLLGGSVAAAGAAFRVWAAGHIEKGKVLTQGGPYALTRNPLYLGSLLMALGILMAGQGYWLLMPFGLFFAVFYYPVMKAEEEELLQGYGESFLDYAKRVPLFVPRFRAAPENASVFLWSRVIRNREHRTVAGLIVVGMFLIVIKIVG
ncbi:MAG: isoprenylcysteine carboxylmethyltransferase family protein [Acidobacteria bacterium]|nr:isoprenylcysteine carboxylmethyltransferase family protein [Acidobacteriota bacterium]